MNTRFFHGVKRNEVGLKFLPQPDYLEFTLPNDRHILVTNEGSELTSLVRAQLEAKGNKVVVLNLPNSSNPISENAVNLSAYSDDAVKTAIQQVHTNFGKVGSFIYLHPHFVFQDGIFQQHFKAEKEIIKSLFFLAKHLREDLNVLGQTHRACFLTVTRMDGKLGQGGRDNISIIGGGIPGLVKSFNLEWPPVFCRTLDIQPELDANTMANQIMAELHDANVRTVEVAFSDEGRKTTKVTPDNVPENQAIKTSVSEKSVFLISGGARGVTANCVIEMAKTFQCKFILLGRSGLDFEVPTYANSESDERTLKRLIMSDLQDRGKKPTLPLVGRIYSNVIAKKEIDTTIAQIEKHGGEVVYIQGDVTKLSGFKVALDKAITTLGEVTGIIHGAGRLADKYIQDKTEADFENVLSVKLDGLLTLLGAINLNKLGHLILFSSVAGFYGNIGQTDYAMANEILNKVAHLFKTNHPNTHVSAINWGAWNSGMVSNELKTQFKAAGITLINNEGGAAMLVNELNNVYANQPQVIIGSTLPEAKSHIGELKTYRIHRQLKLNKNPFLMHHVIKGHAVLPMVNAVGWMVQTCENLYPDYAFFQIEDIRLFKGIVFDGKQKENYITETKELEKSVDKIIFETLVVSEGDKLPTYHYKAKVTVVNKKAIPVAPNFIHKISSDYTPIKGDDLYKNGTLFHNKYFRGIDHILDCTDNHIVLSCKAPEVPLSDQGQFQVQSINTFFADIQFQGIVVWVYKNMGGAKGLPQQADQTVLYKTIPFGKILFVNITFVEKTEFNIAAECTVYDSKGIVYMKTKGAMVTLSNELVW